MNHIEPPVNTKFCLFCIGDIDNNTDTYCKRHYYHIDCIKYMNEKYNNNFYCRFCSFEDSINK